MNKKMWLLCILVGSVFFSCAAIMQNMRSVTRTVLDKAPYYHKKPISTDVRIGHIPIRMDKRMIQEFHIFSDDQHMLLQPLLDALNNELDALNPHLLRPVEPVENGPDVIVGNSVLEDDESSEEQDDRVMIAQFTSGTQEWNEFLAENMLSKSIDYVLCIQLGFSEYLPRQTDWKGSKVLELGTGYSVQMKWLSDLNTPHEVLHLTGVLLDREGKAVSYGAEGIIYEKTDFGWSLFDIQENISDEKIQKLLEETRREDLPGSPLNWQAALQNLVAQLTGQQSLLLQ